MSGAQRSTSRWKEAGRVHHAVGFDLRQEGELRLQHRNAGKIEIALPLDGEDFSERRVVIDLLETGRA